ncbi:hypothetical protein MXB_397, partial [Myxobolus squamalis]
MIYLRYVGFTNLVPVGTKKRVTLYTCEYLNIKCTTIILTPRQKFLLEGILDPVAEEYPPGFDNKTIGEQLAFLQRQNGPLKPNQGGPSINPLIKLQEELSKHLRCVYCGASFLHIHDHSEFEDHITSCQNNEFLRWEIEENSQRACPVCRVVSNYIIPSYYFPQNLEEKQTIISSYREALKYDSYILYLRQKHCIHFNRGRSHCPFSTSCFFKHGIGCFYKSEFPDGTLADESHLLVNSDGYYQIYSPY